MVKHTYSEKTRKPCLDILEDADGISFIPTIEEPKFRHRLISYFADQKVLIKRHHTNGAKSKPTPDKVIVTSKASAPITGNIASRPPTNTRNTSTRAHTSACRDNGYSSTTQPCGTYCSQLHHSNHPVPDCHQVKSDFMILSETYSMPPTPPPSHPYASACATLKPLPQIPTAYHHGRWTPSHTPVSLSSTPPSLYLNQAFNPDTSDMISELEELSAQVKHLNTSNTIRNKDQIAALSPPQSLKYYRTKCRSGTETASTTSSTRSCKSCDSSSGSANASSTTTYSSVHHSSTWFDFNFERSETVTSESDSGVRALPSINEETEN